jgi:hypothetical protein
MPFHNKNSWTKKEIEYLKANWGHEPLRYIVFELKKSMYAVKKKAAELNLPKNVVVKTWGRRADTILRENYLKLSNIELAKKLNEQLPYYKKSFKATSISSRLVKLGLIRNDQQLAYIKGRNIKNGSMKGKRPSRELEIGHLSLKPDYYNYNGVRKPAYIIKVAKDRWQLFKHYVWEQHWGPVPKGWQVSCLNGNDLNFTIEDLILTKKRGSVDKALDELSDNFVMSFFLMHRPDKEEVKALYQKNPESFRGIIETLRAKLKLQRKIDGKKKNK